MKIWNVQDVQRHKSNFVTRLTTGKIQWRYDDGDWRRIRMDTKFYESSISQVSGFNAFRMNLRLVIKIKWQ